jgi:hypothetical protein
LTDGWHACAVDRFTHRERTALAGGEFFARVTFRVIHNGLTPRQAIEQVAAESDDRFIKDKVKQALAKVPFCLSAIRSSTLAPRQTGGFP